MNVHPVASNIVLPGGRARRPLDKEQYAQRHRVRVLNESPPIFKNNVVAFLGEFVGTSLFLFFAFAGTQIANTLAPGGLPTNAPNTANILYISLAFGMSLAVNAWVFFRVTGGMFNPAVTLGLCLIGAVAWTRGLVVFLAQICGGIAASALVAGLFPGAMGVATTLSDETSIVRGLFIEVFLTAELLLTIFMLAAEKSKTTFIAPVGIGLALFIAHLAGVFFTGASLNPARSFGPCVILGQFPGYHWIYWVGPILGSLVAVIFYKMLKALEYEAVNPGQDADHEPRQFQHDPDAAITVQRYETCDLPDFGRTVNPHRTA